MKRIKELVDRIDEELCDAKEYAEESLTFKAKNMPTWSAKYKQIAQEELNHAMIVHDYTVQEIEELRKVYTPPVEMQEMWDKEHKEYIEKTAWIKQMLAM